MKDVAKGMTARGPFDGLRNVVHFNWPYYGVALLVLTVALIGMVRNQSVVWYWVSAAIGAFTLVSVALSLSVSHYVYDRSPLNRGTWLPSVISGTPGTPLLHATFCHTGFDESSSVLRTTLGAIHWTVLDHFDHTRMTEASIRRARRAYPPVPETVAAPFGAWPLAAHSTELVIGMLAIHELRHASERVQWFSEAKRALTRTGRVVIVEHVRDLANICVFGPGALHFHSPRTWRTNWQEAGLTLQQEFRITPWVRVFVLVSQ